MSRLYPAKKTLCVILLATLFMTFMLLAKVDVRAPRQRVTGDCISLSRKFQILEKKLNEFVLSYERNISLVKVSPIISRSGYHTTDNPNYANIKSSSSHKLNKSILQTKIKCETDYRLLILVSSHVSNFEQRHVIRNTWGKRIIEKWQWKVFFLIGKSKYKKDRLSVKKENSINKDLILSNTYEDFFSLTDKLRVGLQWSSKHCNFSYLLKSDDDVFINIPQLFAFLNKKHTPKTDLYAGNVQYFAVVARYGRYGVTQNEYPKKRYPRYCSGGGFVLSRDTVRKFVNHFADVPYMKIDDAYIGELALKSGIDVYHDDNFKMFEDASKCSYEERYIVHHPVKSRQCMEKLYAKNQASLNRMNSQKM